MGIRKIFCLILLCFTAVFMSSCGDKVPNAVFSPDDLAGKQIGVIEGSAAAVRAADLEYSGITVKAYTDIKTAKAALKSGEVDCLLVDSPDADAAARGLGVVQLDESVPDETYRFAVAKENVDLTQDINDALAQLRENGVLDNIIAGYTGGSDYRYESSAGEHTASIVMAVETAGAPYCYYDGDELRGMDIDIARAVGDILGVDVEFKTVPHDELIVEAQKGRAMFAAGRLAENDDGAELVDFTDGYFASSQKIIVRK